MSRLIKIQRVRGQCEWLDVFRNVDDKESFTCICAQTFSLITGIKIAEDDFRLKYVSVTEVKAMSKRVMYAYDKKRQMHRPR